ncbi:MAG: hypothetical protein LIO77_04895 [Rikenellaceae bacterium]|nr:hypothetical protein [Rikenellaceae bacterium]
MKRTCLYILFSLPFLAVLLGACVKEDPVEKGEDPGDEVEVTFTYRVDGMSTLTQTRLSDDLERKVETVYVFIYEVGTDGVERLAYIRPSSNISADLATGTGTFTTRLSKSRSTEKYTYDVLVNTELISASTITSSLDVGQTRQEVRELVKLTNTFPNGITALPMWAGIKKEDAITIDGSTSIHLNFIRSVLRLDIGLNLGEMDDTAAGLSNFTLRSVYLQNGPGVGYYFPDPDNIASDGTVIAPSITPYTIYSTTNRTATGDGIVGQWYIFEPDVNFINGYNKFTIVLMGDYTDEDGVTATYYYPIRLRDPNDPDKLLDMLRNHKYRINITAINGPGYDNLTAASRGESMDIVFDLLVNAAGEINHIVYSDQYYLGVSQVLFEFPGTALENGIIKIMTNMPNGWSVTLMDSDGNTPGPTEVRSVTSGSTSLNTIGTYTFTFQTANTSATKTYYVTVTANYLSIPVTIVRSTL